MFQRFVGRFLLLAAVVGGGIALPASDWPQWRGPTQDGHAPLDAPVLTNLPAEPRVLWEIPAGEGLASPVATASLVLAFDNQQGRETLRALDPATGTERWRADIDEPFSDTQGPTGPRNTPLIDGDRVYAVSCRGELQCRLAHDGALVWRANYVRDFGASFIGEKGSAPGASRHGNDASPFVDGDDLLACVGGQPGAGLVCFDKRSGRVRWKSTDDQAGYAPPVVTSLLGERQVVAFTAAGVVGLSRTDGAERWRVPVKTAFSRHVITPLVREDRIVVSSHQAGLLGIALAHVGDQWEARTAWTNPDGAINYACPVASGRYLYGVGPYRDLICADLVTGRVAWSQEGFFNSPAGKAYGGFIVTGDNVLLLTDSGELVLFAADPSQYRELARVQICGLNWCNPAYANGVLYLRDGLKQGGHWKALRLAPNG